VWFATLRAGESLALVAGWDRQQQHPRARVLLVGVVEATVLFLRLGTFGGNPRSHVGSGEGGVCVSLCLLGLRLGCSIGSRDSWRLLVVGGGEFMATLAASNRRTRLRVW
jgi:hypothetical protein